MRKEVVDFNPQFSLCKENPLRVELPFLTRLVDEVSKAGVLRLPSTPARTERSRSKVPLFIDFFHMCLQTSAVYMCVQPVNSPFQGGTVVYVLTLTFFCRFLPVPISDFFFMLFEVLVRWRWGLRVS